MAIFSARINLLFNPQNIGLACEQKYALKELLLNPFTRSGLSVRQSLQTHAVQPNIVETRKALIQILVDILKFPANISKMMLKTWRLFLFNGMVKAQNTSWAQVWNKLIPEYKCDTIRQCEIRPFQQLWSYWRGKLYVKGLNKQIPLEVQMEGGVNHCS